jgi:hypothetical protein
MLQDSAVLAWLHMARWTGRRYDDTASALVFDTFLTENDAGRFNKKLVTAVWLRPIERVITRARAAHYKLTLPWLDNGSRMLPTKMIWEYGETISKYRDEFAACRDSMIYTYDEQISLGERRLKELFDKDEYPSAKQLAKKFKFEHVLLPIPTRADFRLEVNELEKQKFEAKLAEISKTAVRDVYDRIHGSLKHLKERLEDTDAKRLHTSMLDNLSELVDIIPKMNITNDPDLDAMCDRLREEIVSSTDIETLRTNSSERKFIANRAKDILNDMAGYMGG